MKVSKRALRFKSDPVAGYMTQAVPPCVNSQGFRYYANQRTYDHRSPPSMYRILSHSSLPVLEKVPSSNPARTGCATLGTSLNFFQTSFHLLCNEDIGTTSEVSSSYSPYPPPTPKKHIKIKIKYEKLWHHCIHSWSAFKLLFYTEIYIHRVLQRNLQLAPSKVNSIFIIASRLPITMEHLGKDSAESVTGTPTESAISHALIRQETSS